MPIKTIHCKICNAEISGYNFAERMSALREHYKLEHPAEWRKSVARGAAKRVGKLRIIKGQYGGIE